MSVLFETVREFRSFLSVYGSTLQSFEDFISTHSSGSSDHQSELLNFADNLQLEDLQVLTVYLHLGNTLVITGAQVFQLPEDELFALIHTSATEVGWVFDSETTDSCILQALVGYSKNKPVFVKLKELSNAFTSL